MHSQAPIEKDLMLKLRELETLRERTTSEEQRKQAEQKIAQLKSTIIR